MYKKLMLSVFFVVLVSASLCAALLDPVTNFAKGIVSTTYDASATSIVLLTGDGANFPSTFSYNIIWWNATDFPDPSDDPNKEIVRVTNRVADTLTVTRAQEGTSATTKNTSGKTYLMVLGITKKVIDDIDLFFLGAESTQTVTNKTINTASNTITVVEADISDLAHTTDTFVTNKDTHDHDGGDGATIEIAGGGSGQTAQQAAIDALTNVSAATNEHILTKDTGTGNAIWKVNPASSPEGTAVLSTGEAGGIKFLREDGDNSCSWQTIAGGGDALVANPLSQFAATTSLQLLGVLSDETGTGLAVFGTSPTLVTPLLGTPTSGVLTNCTGLPVAGLANGTDGELITWDAAGAPATVAVGTATHVLTSNGVGTAPTFQATISADATIKGWVNFDGTGTIAIQDSFNVTGLVDNGTGDYTVTWDVDFANANYSVAITSTSQESEFVTMAVGSTRFITRVSNGTANDSSLVAVISIGDQ